MTPTHETSREVNRARWNELAALHVRSPFYGVEAFRAGSSALDPIVDAGLGLVAGLRIAHLQCHFGLDTLTLARRGATVTGLDFSSVAIAEARRLSGETGVAGTFVEGDVFEAPRLLGAGAFDLVYVTWGAINWLPDIRAWARAVAGVLAPGGRLFMAEGHPVLYSLDQTAPDAPIRHAFPYFQGQEPLVSHSDVSYSEDSERLTHTEMHEWVHPLGAIVSALIEAGLALDWLREHDAVPWRALPSMAPGADGLYRPPPEMPSLPLAFSLSARRPG
jgi:2-polyprenyl-3-methyl-5-hydroxy-6-metoxy-1,4-benzoquinol methylase